MKTLTFSFFMIFCSIWFRVFFKEYSRITGQQGKREVTSLIPLYHVHPPYKHLDIIRLLTAESSPPHIDDSRTQIGNT